MKCYAVKNKPDQVLLTVRDSYNLTLGITLVDVNGKPIVAPPSPPRPKLPTPEEMKELFSKINASIRRDAQ